MVSRIMLLLRTKSWMEKVAGKSAHSSLHQAVMFLLITDREKSTTFIDSTFYQLANFL